MADKDTLWFKHDYNARGDRKMAALILTYKSAGYGIYWTAVEMLHEEGGTLEYDDLTFSAIAKDLMEDLNLVRKVMNDCVKKFQLFTVSKKKFSSARVDENIKNMKAVSESRSAAGKASGEARRRRTNVQQTGTNVQQMSTDVEQTRTKLNKNEQSRVDKSRIEYSSIDIPKELFAIASNESTAKKLIEEVWSYFDKPEGFQSKTEADKLWDKASNIKKLHNPKKYIETWILNYGKTQHKQKTNGHGTKQVGDNNAHGYSLLSKRATGGGKKKITSNQN